MASEPDDSGIEQSDLETDEVYRPGLALYGVAVFAGLVILAAFASHDFVVLLTVWAFGLPLWLGLPVGWTMLFAIDLVRSRLRLSPMNWARWMALPAMGILCVALALTGAPFLMRFDLSRTALDEAAARSRAGERIDPGWIGLFQFDAVWEQGNDIYFGGYATTFFDPCYLVHSPEGEPSGVVSDLGGGWWEACG
jgi:hypothetical protein